MASTRQQEAVSLFLLLVLAVIMRFPYLDDQYFTLLPVREYRSAIIARSFFFNARPEIPQWQQEIATISMQREGLLEPPVTEWVTASLYRLSGGELTWAPRIVALGFWLSGAVFLFLLLRRWTILPAALGATAYFLFAPLAMQASLSFMPDPLMIMLLIFSLWAIVRHDEKPTTQRLVVAGLGVGLCLLVKPVGLFTLLGSYIALKYRRGGLHNLFGSPSIVFYSLAAAPVATYYAYGLFAAGFLENQAAMSFMPHLLLTRYFWKEWFFVAGGAVGWGAVIAGLFGYILLSPGPMRTLLFGYAGGYILFGLVFTYHIHTHGYYHLQLLVLISLSLGPLLTIIGDRIFRRGLDRQGMLALLFAALVLLMLSTNETRHKQSRVSFEPKHVAEQIGELTHHSGNVVYLARYYGRPLEYLGQLSGIYWERPVRTGIYYPGKTDLQSVEDRLKRLDFEPAYFVVSDFAEFQNHHEDLRSFLENECRLIAKTDQYLVYNECVS